MPAETKTHTVVDTFRENWNRPGATSAEHAHLIEGIRIGLLIGKPELTAKESADWLFALISSAEVNPAEVVEACNVAETLGWLERDQ